MELSSIPPKGESVRRLLVSAAILALVVLNACIDDGADPTGDGPTERVEISNFEFNPDRLTISVGTTVIWENTASGTSHTSNSEDAVWGSGTLKEGDEFSFTFDEVGTFPYFCTFHPDLMKGTIVVEE
jgi:plastocyanin